MTVASSTPRTMAFANDPTAPSLAKQATANLPIYIPWNRTPVSLGAGLVISHNSDIVPRSSPFAPTTDPAFIPRSISTLEQHSSSHATASHEHLDASLQLSVGSSFLGASGRARFMENVVENRDTKKVSLQSSYRVGQITFDTFPRLSAAAKDLLSRNPDQFHATYGQYFAYSYSIGADTSTFLSTSASHDLQQELRDIVVKAKILFITATVYDDHYSKASTDNAYDITYNGFDSLTDYGANVVVHAENPSAFDQVQREAVLNVLRGESLVQRFGKRMKEVGVDCEKQTSVSPIQVDGTFTGGLVTEVLFLPFALLREYVETTHSRHWAS